MQPGGVYLITDRRQLAPGRRLVDVVEAALRGGIRAVQLREKDLPAAELYNLATELRRVTRHHGAVLLLNDRVDVALAVEADGVHLGRQSLTPRSVRRIAGASFVIGVSTHNLSEVASAGEEGADFVTFGPVYATPSKAAYGPPVGLEALRAACAEGLLPVYGLGGIKDHNRAEVLAAGACGVALISAIISAPDPEQAARALNHGV